MQAEIRKVDESREFLAGEGCYILELSNDEADPAASIARARVPAGGCTEWHWLSGTEERYLVISGRGRVEVEGLPATAVGPGDVVRIPAGVGQRIANTGPGDLVFFCICTPRFQPECYREGQNRQN